jgi:hypothetical protein
MEVKIKDMGADSPSLVVDLSKEDIHELAKRTAPHYTKYFDDVINDDGKLTQNNIAENELFFAIIKECQNIEEVIFITFHFKATVSAVLAHGLKMVMGII